jgi:hypothetical protein
LERDDVKVITSKMETLLGIKKNTEWAIDTLYGRIAVVLGRLSIHYNPPINEKGKKQTMPIHLPSTQTKVKSSGYSGLDIGKRPVNRNEKFVRDKIIELIPKINPYFETDPKILLTQNEYEYFFSCISGLIDVYKSLVADRTQNMAPKQESYYYNNIPIQERMSDYVRSISDPEYQKFLSTSQDEDKQVEFNNLSTLRNIIHNMILQYTKEADQLLQSRGSNIKTYTQQLEKYLQGQKYASRGPEAAAAAKKYTRPSQIQAPPEQEPPNNDAEPDWHNSSEDDPFNITKERFFESKKRAIKDSKIPRGTYIFEADWYEF